MSKPVIRAICIVLCVALLALIPILIFACSEDNVYELGPYALPEDEYVYLFSTYKRKILDELKLDEYALTTQISNDKSTTYAQAIEASYRSQFEQTVYSLLYCQALFDEYNLELSQEHYDRIEGIVDHLVFYYGGGSESAFNSQSQNFGYTADTLRRVYEKQAKQTVVINHLLGSGYSKLTESDKNDYYEDNFIHFQVIVVNTLYGKNSDGTYSNLPEETRKTMLKLEAEVTDLLCRGNKNTADYELLPKLFNTDDVSTITYEDIWNHPDINDELSKDKNYPGGIFMTKPNALQLTTVNTLSQAWYTEVGDVSPCSAKQYFQAGGTIMGEDGYSEIKAGDYFEYGTAFIKRLPLDKNGWKDKANADFFPDSSFLGGAATQLLLKTLQEFEKTSPYTLVVYDEYKNEYNFENIVTNRVDYDTLNPTDEEETANGE